MCMSCNKRPEMEHCSSTSPERALLDILDFTLLDHNATISDLDDFARKAAAAQPAAVCVYTEHIHHMKMRLSNSGILLAAVAGGFPVGDNSVETLSNAVREAVSAGADEIDFVLEPGHSEAFPGPHEESLLRAAREASQDCTLKVILETSLLSEAAMVSVADLALQCGADFLKTSTGKRGGASALSARLLVAAIRRYEEHTGIKRGIKLSGGIRTAQDADELLAGVRSTHPAITENSGVFRRTDRARIRIGASTLLRELMPELYESPLCVERVTAFSSAGGGGQY